jgi:hypothetical protein
MSQVERGLAWYEFSMLFRDRFRPVGRLIFANVATHNHFSFSDRAFLFNAHAPVMRFAAGCDEGCKHGLLGLLNTSTACFWMKQIFHPKKGSGIGRGIQPEPWMERYEFTSTGLKQFPVTDERPLDLARALDRLARALAACDPAALLADDAEGRHH